MNVRPLLLCCATVLSVQGEVLHQSSFDDSLQALPQGTWEGKKQDFVPGVVGRGIHVKGNSDVTLRQTIDFPRNEGTLSFWLKTDWSGNDDKRHDILGIGSAVGIRIIKSEKNELLFFWSAEKGKQVKMSYSVERTWPADDWRHLAFTWKDNAWAVYMDGTLQRREASQRDLGSLAALDIFLVGSFEGAPADLSIDDLTIHDIELERREVRQAFVTGIEHLEHRSVPRLVMRALVNRQPATLIMDTGSTLNCLFRDFALQAGVTPRRSDRGGMLFQEEADAFITLKEGEAFTQPFALLKNVAEFRQQGIVGWAYFFEANLLRILWEERTMQPLSRQMMEAMTRGWQAHSYPIGKGTLKIPRCSIRIDDFELNLPVIVDTGESGGLTLTSKTWDSVLPKLSSAKRSLDAAWTPISGQKIFVSVAPQSISMLGAEMHDVSISENRHQKKGGQNEEHASIGLAALSYFEVVIDGEKGNLWLRPRATPAIRENLNTSGLLFYAATNEAGNKLEVLEGSPAWNFGLRSQDSILTVDGKKLDVKNLDQMILLKDQISAGKPVRLKVVRGAKLIEVGESASQVR